jgi:hypothetical protein
MALCASRSRCGRPNRNGRPCRRCQPGSARVSTRPAAASTGTVTWSPRRPLLVAPGAGRSPALGPRRFKIAPHLHPAYAPDRRAPARPSSPDSKRGGNLTGGLTASDRGRTSTSWRPVTSLAKAPRGSSSFRPAWVPRLSPTSSATKPSSRAAWRATAPPLMSSPTSVRRRPCNNGTKPSPVPSKPICSSSMTWGSRNCPNMPASISSRSSCVATRTNPPS